MKLTVEIDDDEIHRVQAPWFQRAPRGEPPRTKLLSVQEVADQLGVSLARAHRLVTSGDIESISIGRNRRITPAALTAFISKSRPRARLSSHAHMLPGLARYNSRHVNPDQSHGKNTPAAGLRTTGDQPDAPAGAFASPEAHRRRVAEDRRGEDREGLAIRCGGPDPAGSPGRR